MERPRKKLILINGNGGSGKKTNAQLLYSKLPDAAWIHMRWLLALKSWAPTERFTDLGLRNAAAVINNYFSEGVEQVIYSGLINTQQALKRLLSLIEDKCSVSYFWLHADKSILRQRLIKRARDDGDKPEFVDYLLSTYHGQPPLIAMSDASYFVIDTNSKPPEQIVEEMISSLKVSRLE
jgi:thymidylate kinase